MKVALQGHDFQSRSTHEIRRDVADIQSQWSARERQKRAVMGLVRQIELLQLCGLLPTGGTPNRLGTAV